MFQKFYEDTLIGRFIKRLLRSTNLPILPIIQHNDYIVKDSQYIFRGYIIQALTSGQFCVDPDAHFGVGTYYTDKAELEEAEEETTGKIKRADYKVICRYDENNKQHSYNFHSKFMYYDPETHYQLGKYIRFIKDTAGINLFPYYNCFSGKSITNFEIDKDNSIQHSSWNNSKILLIPAKYGKTYTVAINSETQITVRPIIYENNTELVISDKFASAEPDYFSNIDEFKNATERFPSSDFLKPFTITLPNPPNIKTYSQEKNLYLGVQVPLANSSGLVALEGAYTDTWINRNNGKVIKSLDPSSRDFNQSADDILISNLSLLHFDSKSTIAFSDRLIEYLLLQTINKTETIDWNINYVQELLGAKFNTSDYTTKFTKGVWDTEVTKHIHKYITESKARNTLIDLDGSLNKDLERLLLVEGRK